MDRNLPQLSKMSGTPGRRYIFFSSLEHREQELAIQTKKALEGLQNEIQYDKNNTSMNRMKEALEFLRQSAHFERAKEQQFFSNFKSKYPNCEQVFNINLTNPTPEEYMSFIANINTTLKGVDTFKKRLKTELSRLNRVKEFKRTGDSDQLIYNANNLQKKVAEANKDALTFFKRGGKAHARKGSGEGGEQTFQDIFSRRTNMSQLTEVLLQSYGADIFTFSKDKLDLSPRKTAALIKALTDVIYAMYISEYEILTRNSTEPIREMILGDNFQNFVKNLLQAPSLPDALADIANQYQLSEDVTDISDVNQQINNLKSDIKQSVGRVYANIPETMTTEQWLKFNGISNTFLKQMYKSTLTVSASAYYVGEDLAIMEQISNRLGASLGGNVNTTDDIYGGKFVAVCEINQNFDAVEQYLLQASRGAYKQLVATSGLDTFFSNTEKLKAARKLQEDKIKELEEELDKTNEAGKYLLSHINIHTTVKGYTTNIASGSAFTGASFGSNLPTQLDIMQQMADSGGFSLGDLEFLQFACVNAGEGMIGHFLKPTLENYFSTFVGFLMFNDAALMFEDTQKWIESQDKAISGVNDIHLYELNGVTIPSSYLLENTYQALIKVSADLQQNNRFGVQARLSTYDKGPIYGDREEVFKTVLSETKLKIHFLAGFLDILDSISGAIPG